MNASKAVSTTDAALVPVNNVSRTVSGIAFYVEVDEKSPTKLTALHVLEDDKIEKFRAKCDLEAPLKPGQEVICTVGRDGAVSKVTGGVMDQNCSRAIKMVNQFMNFVVRQQWDEAKRECLSSSVYSGGHATDNLALLWKNHEFKPVVCDPKLLDAYGGHYPQVYRLVRVDSGSATIFVDERKLFVDRNRVALIAVYGEGFKITRIQTGEELDESK